jgi:succinoglycan biosynthesis protein ExoL
MRIGYIVHDLADPAVARRVRMLEAGGAQVRLAGFRRGEVALHEVAGVPALDLGQTRDAAMTQRAVAVLRACLDIGPLHDWLADCEVVMARNLESLTVASRIRHARRLVYECLDIHRMLTGTGPHHRAVQAVERALLASIDLLVTSSPAFVRAHFAGRTTAPVLLVENKLLRLDLAEAGQAHRDPVPPATVPPFVIGWFGMLRCRRSLDTLCALAATLEGRVEVVIAGKPSPVELPDLAERAAASPHVTFTGPYDAAGLKDLYARCHFAWAIDWFEEGQNSAWLLPNRLYEAQAHGCVPLALAGVETGNWLAAHGTGVVLAPDASDLVATMQAMDAQRLADLRKAVLALDPAALVATKADCAALVDALRGV